MVAAGCGDDGPPIEPPDGGIDAFVPPWWTPTANEGANWDIQLVAPFDVSAQREMYTLDLWDLAPAMTFDYGGGNIVTIPAGPLADKIGELHATGAEVVCRIDVGAIALDDPDASLFPGSTTPNDRPTDPEAGSVVGWSVFPDSNTRYLDLRSAAYATWRPLVLARFDLAKQLGCDAIGVARVDQFQPGFPLEGNGTSNDITRVYDDIVTEIHARELSAGLVAEQQIGKTLGDTFADRYDFAIEWRCAEFDDCDMLKDFSFTFDKAIFGVDFETDGTTDRDMDDTPDGVSLAIACTRTSLPAAWIQKDADAVFLPSSAVRATCP